jgi:hypothetical protein
MQPGTYRIEMDGRWSLKDLYEVPHAYLQVYAFIYAFDTELPERDADRINYALESYPWAGGYSVVNMYTVLQTQVGAEFKPVIKEIRYASPGWIELYLHLHPAVKIAGAVATIAASATGTVKAYASIQDLLYKIRARAKKAGIERIQLTRQEIQELHALNQELAKFIGFNSLDELEARSGRADVTAKLLSAQYRRLRALAEFVSKGKVKLPLPPPALPLPPLPPVNRR